MKTRVLAACAVLAGAGAASGQEVFLTHNVVPNVVLVGQVACTGDDGVTVTENSYYRSYNLAAFGVSDDFQVTTINWAIDIAQANNGGGGTQPVSLRVYRDVNGGAPFLADLVLLGSVDLDQADMQLVLVDTPLTADAPAGSTIVVEVYNPEATGLHAFWPGSNNFGQTAPSYVYAAPCNDPDILNVTGVEGGVSCYADCNGDGVVNIFDFLCFQGKVSTGDPSADCNGDGPINIFDFLCFQGAVTQGC
jgi:hypothetical protein